MAESGWDREADGFGGELGVLVGGVATLARPIARLLVTGLEDEDVPPLDVDPPFPGGFEEACFPWFWCP
ncbi:hypothetical protein [Actinoplanes rectilineatus]|uniref:hypothetical protein n=1 Tax=Actinoplanes rectilineatus TaxID=113571 RepID=UPI0012F7F781|nr:hypothetical protein [Actinoplanes rectilineatus]